MKMVAQTFNPSTQGRGKISEFKDSLVYNTSSWTGRATQRNPILKTKHNKNKERLHWSDLGTVTVVVDTVDVGSI